MQCLVVVELFVYVVVRALLYVFKGFFLIIFFGYNDSFGLFLFSFTFALTCF